MLVSLMGSSFLSEVDNTSILRTGALPLLALFAQLGCRALGSCSSGLERSDFVRWHVATFIRSSLRSVTEGTAVIWLALFNYLLALAKECLGRSSTG